MTTPRTTLRGRPAILTSRTSEEISSSHSIPAVVWDAGAVSGRQGQQPRSRPSSVGGGPAIAYTPRCRLSQRPRPSRPSTWRAVTPLANACSRLNTPCWRPARRTILWSGVSTPKSRTTQREGRQSKHAGDVPRDREEELDLAADWGESEPWTRFSVISTAKSPRIVPGGAWRGVGRSHERPDHRRRLRALDSQRQDGPGR